MAEVVPFKGILYNPEKISNLADVVAPPYDVISQEEHKALHNRHPNNIVRLILGEKTEEDTKENNPHTRAAGYFNDWISEDILSRDDSNAFYLTSVEFELEKKKVTRFGLIALVGIVPFDEGIVLPHEKTFSKVKSERLELFKICKANFSPIFSLYSDTGNILKTLIDSISGQQPDMDIESDKGEKHMMWRISDPDVRDFVSNAMENKKLYIADGHHRYETSLNYRKFLSETDPAFNEEHPANYVMMYLCSMEDPGMVVLPAHRMLHDIPDSKLEMFIENAKEYFDISEISLIDMGPEKARSDFISSLRSNSDKNTIGVYIKNRKIFYIISLKPGIMEMKYADEMPESLLMLDVTVLTRLCMMDILGFDQAMLDNEKLISYSSVDSHAIDAVDSGKCDIAFILNSTKIEQVKNIAEQGQVMPRKTTYFYPKAITGQVMNTLE
ncbi:MAG: DUF1015 domain-containing protein [Desulfobacterales bacterium]|nr:DUF1015 domain-containing protein [Desulfobacterales bacterium]